MLQRQQMSRSLRPAHRKPPPHHLLPMPKPLANSSPHRPNGHNCRPYSSRFAPKPDDDEIKWQQAVADGDRFWDSNDKEAAVEKYLIVVNAGFTYGIDSDLSRVYSRIVDYAASNGDKAMATSVLEEASKREKTLHLREPKAKEWSAEVASPLKTRHRAEQEYNRLKERDEKQGRTR
jgi:hypothetical protein